jgi:hypothetical protein
MANRGRHHLDQLGDADQCLGALVITLFAQVGDETRMFMKLQKLPLTTVGSVSIGIISSTR